MKKCMRFAVAQNFILFSVMTFLNCINGAYAKVPLEELLVKYYLEDNVLTYHRIKLSTPFQHYQLVIDKNRLEYEGKFFKASVDLNDCNRSIFMKDLEIYSYLFKKYKQRFVKKIKSNLLLENEILSKKKKYSYQIFIQPKSDLGKYLLSFPKTIHTSLVMSEAKCGK